MPAEDRKRVRNLIARCRTLAEENRLLRAGVAEMEQLRIDFGDYRAKAEDRNHRLLHLVRGKKALAAELERVNRNYREDSRAHSETSRKLTLTLDALGKILHHAKKAGLGRRAGTLRKIATLAELHLKSGK